MDCCLASKTLLGHLRRVRRFGGGSAKRVVYDFARRHQAHTPAKGRVARSFALGEVCKVLLTFALLVMALAVLKVVFMPLIATWVLVLVVQVLAPAVINNKG